MKLPSINKFSVISAIMGAVAATLAIFAADVPQFSPTRLDVADRADRSGNRDSVSRAIAVSRSAEREDALRTMDAVFRREEAEIAHESRLDPGSAALRWRSLERLRQSMREKGYVLGEVTIEDEAWRLDREESQRDALVKASFARLRALRLYHNQPKELPYDQPTKIVLSIASNNLRAAQERALKAIGPTKTAVVKVGLVVRGELSGADEVVKIQPITPLVQSVSSGANTTWEWWVTPKTTDDIELTLRLFNQVRSGDETIEQERPVYRSTFTVNASLWQRFLAMLDGSAAFFTILGTGLLAMLAAVWRSVVYFKRRFWGAEPSETKKTSAKKEIPKKAAKR